MQLCADCGTVQPAGVCVDWEGDAICPACLKAYRAPHPFRPEAVVEPSEEWSPRQLFTLRLFRTILLSPARFFEHMPRDRGFGEPVFFAFAWGLFILVLSAPSKYLTLSVIASNASALGAMAPRLVEIAEATMREGFWAFVAASPAYAIVMLAALLALASIQHFFLFLMGRRSRFELTLRVAFFSVAAQALAVVPVPGLSLLAAEVYTVAVQTVGFKRIYRLSTAAAVFVALVPTIIIELIPAGLMGL